jgi:hypothetical protein
MVTRSESVKTVRKAKLHSRKLLCILGYCILPSNRIIDSIKYCFQLIKLKKKVIEEDVVSQ